MDELPSAIANRVSALSSQGDVLARNSQFAEAVREYSEAWKLLPEPKNHWNASTWLLAAIGDACFLGGYFESAQDAFAHSMACPNGVGNPFLHMRLGQCQLELNNPDGAAEELCRAYALEGKGIFSQENPKYFEFLQTRIRPPVSGVW